MMKRRLLITASIVIGASSLVGVTAINALSSDAATQPASAQSSVPSVYVNSSSINEASFQAEFIFSKAEWAELRGLSTTDHNKWSFEEHTAPYTFTVTKGGRVVGEGRSDAHSEIDGMKEVKGATVFHWFDDYYSSPGSYTVTIKMLGKQWSFQPTKFNVLKVDKDLNYTHTNYSVPFRLNLNGMVTQ